MDKEIAANPYLKYMQNEATKKSYNTRVMPVDTSYKIPVKVSIVLKHMTLEEIFLGLDEAAESFAFSLAIAPDINFISGKKIDFDEVLNNLAAMYFGIAIKTLSLESKLIAIESFDRFVDIFKDTYIAVRADPESWC